MCVLLGKQKIHYTFTDGSEMVEEYDMRNYDLLGNVFFNIYQIMRYCKSISIDDGYRVIIVICVYVIK